MGLNENSKQKKLLFLKCKKSVQEIIGWKVFIFLPQNHFWRFLISFTVFININLCFSKWAYSLDISLVYFVESCCDIIYMVDTVLAMMHYTMVETRKLRHGKTRHAVLIVIDCISLIPLTMVYDYLIYNLYPKDINSYYFRVNVLLRVYQIPKGFSEVRSGIYQLKTYFMLTLLEVLLYVLLLSHFFSCIIVLLLDADQKKRCRDNVAGCMLENELIALSLLLQCFIPPYSDYPLEDYKLFLIIVFFLGYFFTFGFIMPLLLFVSLKCLAGFFENTDKWRHLKMLLKNMPEIDKKLSKKICNYFHYVLTYGKSDRRPEILKLFPLCFKKNIFCDLHWDAIRHSDFLGSLSLGCKRSMALCMKTEFLLPEAELYNKTELKTCFIYLESGILQIMSEENNQAPVMNFSGGTVFGEISFFLHVKSVALLKAAEFSVIHILTFRDFFRVLSDYPKDLKRVFKKFTLRIQLAKSVYVNKMEIFPYFSMEKLDLTLGTPLRHGNIKWVKQQYRAISELLIAEKAREIDSNKENNQKYENKLLALQTQLSHTSTYLSLICVEEKTVRKFKTVCTKESFPWMLNPRCNFLFVWKIIISVLEVVTIFLYPAVIGWFPYLPGWFFNISILITLAYMTDVLMQLITAVNIEDAIITKLSAVVFHRLSNVSFYIDILAALPLQLLIFRDEKYKKRFRWNLYFVNVMFKTYQLIPIINKWTYSPNPGAFFRSCVKYLILLLIIIYWSAAVFSLLDIQCILYECSPNDWFNNFSKATGKDIPIMASFFRALITTLDFSGNDFKTEVYQSFLVFMSIYILCRLFFIALQAECIATYILEFSYVLEYKVMEKFLYEFMEKKKKIGRVRDRVMQTLQFHWNADKGCSITQRYKIFDDLSKDLINEIDRKGIFRILANCKLFEIEDDDFKEDLCKKGVSLYLPANSLLMTLGAQPTCFFVIVKGFIQINSFISGDLKMNVATPIILSESDAFPVVEALSQNPAVISAIAVSDCRLILFDLEDFVSLLIFHGALKDMVEAVKETDLSVLNTAKLGVTPIGDPFDFNEIFYLEAFKKYKFLGVVLKCLLRKKTIDSNTPWYIRWELCRSVFVICDLIFWPMIFAFGAEFRVHKKIIILLLIADLFWIVDFYIRMHVAYYNKKGLYVTHPLATALHYLATAFTSDFIAFIPNLHLIYLLSKNQAHFKWPVGVTHVLVRSISAYRIVGFMYYMQDSKIIMIGGRLILYILFIIMGMHFYLSLMVHFYLEGKIQPNLLLPDDKTLDFNLSLKFYFNEVARTLCMFFRKVSHATGVDLTALMSKAVWGILGYLTQIYLFSHLTLSSMTLNKNLTAYRYRMRSFVHYLTVEKVEEKIATLAQEHFEHEWTLQRGYNLQKIFSHFPRFLHADIMCPLYKKTIQGIASLSKGNESFYKSLCGKVKEVYLQKGSVIIYEKQVQKDIFFVHMGKCSVEKLSKVLIRGSIIGHIKPKYIMKNTITAKTHVKLLKVSWEEFFSTIINFYDTKMAFESEAAKAEDFIESIYIEEEETTLETLFLDNQDYESKFVEFSDKAFDKTQSHKKKVRLKVINPLSIKTQIVTLFFLTTAYITVILIPVVVALRLFSPFILITIYILDIIWILKILVSARTAYNDKKTGDFISNGKALLYRYLRSFDGLIIHVLSVLPIEVIPLVRFGKPISDECCMIMSFCYSNRILRMIYVYLYMHSQSNKVKVSFYKDILANLMRKIAILNFCVCLEIAVNHRNKYALSKCYWSLDSTVCDVLLSSYLCVIDVFVGSGMAKCESKNFFELVFRLLISLWAFVSRAVFLNQILTFFYVAFHSRSDKMRKLKQLERYLLIRKVSPVLFERIKKYFCDLIDSFNEGAEPTFLNAAPSFIKTSIMQELYTQNLLNCYAFQNLDEFFVKQLADRLERNIFFPGDYIAEKGDVDHNMYFIQRGEVYCVEADKKYKALELELDVYGDGEYFGVLQGIFASYPHTNTYRAKTLSVILVLNYEKWADMREAFPDIAKMIYKKCMSSDTKPSNQKAIEYIT